ncbi:MAG: HisA/HisF-related TIM barrel protein [Velocimicrobium sp.]
MLIFPAIFIKNGRCNSHTNQNLPWKLAVEYAQMGASHLHIIDIDGARIGTFVNEESILAILSRVSIPIEVGGGIRSLKKVEHLLDMGASRVVIGTKAVGNPAFVKEVISNFGQERILFSIDTKNGFVVTEGFEKINSMRAIDYAIEMKSYGVKNICYVDASQKKHTSYSFCEEIEALYQKTKLNIIAKGNISSMKELEKLKEVNTCGVVLEENEVLREINIKKAIDIFEKGDSDGIQENNWIYEWRK